MTVNEKYEIIKNNDRNYDYTFYYAVKTTGIYCKPSCKSKLPKKENIEFFNNRTSAIKKGYRACKRCRSDLTNYEPIKDIAKDLKLKIEKFYLQKNLLNKEIKKIGLSKKRIIEIFKEEYNLTPNQYINNLKLTKAKKLLITTNSTITEVAYTSGFSSISSFNKLFKEKTNKTPSNYRRERSKEKKI